MLSELQEMNAENQRLRELVHNLNNKYNALHKDLMKLTHKQHENEVINAFKLYFTKTKDIHLHIYIYI